MQNKYKDVTLGTVEAVFNKLGGLEGVEAFLRGTVEIIMKSIIDWLGTTTTSATTENTTEKFVAKKKFRIDSKEVKFYGIWDNFREWFLSAGDGKTEDPIGEQTLRYGKLTKNSVDGPIIEELGGEAKAETTLSDLYDLLKKQANGEKGVLLINGYANIFYIRDQSGVLRSVYAGWSDGGWRVSAISVECPSEWNAGRQVFSRN